MLSPRSHSKSGVKPEEFGVISAEFSEFSAISSSWDEEMLRGIEEIEAEMMQRQCRRV